MNKLVGLDEAVGRWVRPGTSVHLTTQARAATRAIQRVFDGREMGLTLIIGRVGGGHAADLLASGLVRHVVSGSYGAVSRQYTGRLAQVQRVYESGSVTFENWSFHSLMQRLMAAAQGQPFALTHSLAGSTMAKDNAHAFRQMADPFGSGRTVNLIQALHPDVAVLHAEAADEQGNAILLPPFEEGAWGARAARHGVLVTAEHIVDTDFIRRHSHLVQLPARYVKAVAHVPFGAHPGPFGAGVLDGVRSYDEDEAFNADYFAAVRDPDALHRWVREWILGTDHAGYLDKLGQRRLDALQRPPRGAAAPQEPSDAPARNAPASDNEWVMTLALRHILRRQAEKHYEVYLVGAGLSEVPATAAYTLLARRGENLSLLMGHGYFGFEPSPGRSDPDARTATMATDAPTLYGTLLGGRPGTALAVLGAGQVDRRGNLNSSLVDGQLLTGSGGSNDAASTCDTLVVTRLSRRKLVERVDYVTCPGDSVGAVVTECGVFEKGSDGELVLASYAERDGAGPDATLRDIASRCGWPLATAATLRAEPPPTAEELTLIRRLMPSRYE